MSLDKQHIPAVQTLLANTLALSMTAEQADEAGMMRAEAMLTELTSAMRLLMDGLVPQAQDAVNRAAKEDALPFPVSITAS